MTKIEDMSEASIHRLVNLLQAETHGDHLAAIQSASIDGKALLEMEGWEVRSLTSEDLDSLRSQGVRGILANWAETCSACPKVLEGKELMTDQPWYYRLRHGRWRLCLEGVPEELLVLAGSKTTHGDSVVLASDNANGGEDGWAENSSIKAMLLEHGFLLVC